MRYVPTIPCRTREAETANPFSAELVLNRIVRKTGIPKAALAVIPGLILVIIILIIRALRKKNRFEKSCTKMEETNSDKKPITSMRNLIRMMVLMMRIKKIYDVVIQVF